MNIKWNSETYTQNFDFVHKQSEGLPELIDAQKRAFIVDVGCGNGALTELLQSLGYEVLGIDDSSDMIKKGNGTAVLFSFQKCCRKYKEHSRRISRSLCCI